MNVYELYKKIKKTVKEKYGFLGLNKTREIERIIFEISKIKKEFDISSIPYKNYEQFKRQLIKIRYPNAFLEYPLNSFYLGKLDIKKKNALLTKKRFDVNRVFVERDAIDSKIVKNLKNKFNPEIKIIDSIKNIKRDFDISLYNNRSKNIYLINEKFDFLKHCPCTKNCVSCGYYIIELGFGCPLECQYCFLQGYQNFNGIILVANVNEFTNKIVERFAKIKYPVRVGSGEFSDSLVYDDITEHSTEIINKLKNFKNIIFEFKTKTLNISNLFKAKPYSNIVVSYSLNPQKIIEKTEIYTPSFRERLYSMKKLIDYGYYTAIHFDPIIDIEGWELYYKDMISEIFNYLDKNKIRWISLGTFRFNPYTKKVIENRFPENIILDSEMILDFDNKLRYPYSLRKKMYKYIIDLLKYNKYPVEKIYLCMEEKKMWSDVSLFPSFRWN